MLDMKRTFDEVVFAHATPERAQAIMDNPFYQSLSSSFSGTQEYMAMEKLGQLRAEDRWDLIVVDTPPSRSALDFLDAPKRLGLVPRRALHPGPDGRRQDRRPGLPQGGRRRPQRDDLGCSPRSSARQVLKDLQAFIAALDTMFGGFRERADATYQLLQARGTSFVVVAAPERDALREASYFVERLGEERMPLAGLVLNRVHASGATGAVGRPGCRRAPRPSTSRARTRWRPASCGCTPSGCG